MNTNPIVRLLLAIALAGLLAACTSTAPGRAAGVSLSSEPLLGKFIWHDLITDDPEGAQRFYAGLLGWEFERTTHPRGGDYVLIHAGFAIEKIDEAEARLTLDVLRAALDEGLFPT